MMRPAFRDLLCALGLAVLSVVGPRLEPSYREFWTFLPLAVAAPLVVTGMLLLPRSRAATIVALVIHAVMALCFGLVCALSVFLLFTIYFTGTAVVLGPPAFLLLLNSAVTIGQEARARRER
jgi:hypothetical protein